MTDLEARLDRALRAPITAATWKRIGNLPVPGRDGIEALLHRTKDDTAARVMVKILRSYDRHGGSAFDLTTLRGVSWLPNVGPVGIRAIARVLGHGDLETAGFTHAREGR